ncbi:MAG TPA: hypothetical protein VGI29_05530 [Candidatus Binataceae bacterium]|jgi:hypothetical protein
MRLVRLRGRFAMVESLTRIHLMKTVTVFAALALLLSPTFTSAQLLRGGPIGGRLERFKERMTNKDESIHYDPAVLETGVARNEVIAKLGEPNASQGEGVAREDAWAFFPDGAKFKDPEVTGATIAAAVFTAGMSLAVRKARNTVAEHQLTLYRVHYDTQARVKTVQVVPPTHGSEPAGSPGAASSPVSE